MAENGNGGVAASVQPQLAMNAQYVKDLSFESPNAPQSLTAQAGQPQIQVNVDVQARGVGPDMFEVVLRLNAEAKQSDKTAFVVELVYGGVFTLRNIPQESLEAVCLIECPRLLFPFARRIVADTVRDGGFMPLMLDPIDFAELYRRSKSAQAQTAQPVGQA
jgi:preprotein translocase subunit SecB